MIIISMQGLCSLKDIIIKDGIKYTLYLLCFYLFDAISWTFRRSKETCYENHERENRCKQMKNKKSNDKPLIEPQNAEKDSDSSRNQSCNCNNETTMNMSMNYKNIDSCISHTALKKPIVAPTKYKSYYSRISVENKKSKQINLKYKEMGTQTDSAFSTDNAVQMVSVGTMWPEQEIYGNATHKSQHRDMNQQVNYMADHEITDEISLSTADQLITSCSTSFSSTDLSSNKDTCAAPDINIAAPDINSINTSKKPTRAPPGFPEVPQHPPLLPSNYNSENLLLPFIKDEYIPNFCIKPAKFKPAMVIPPAPPPMRHLYYDYPEFMKQPTYSN